LRLPWLQGSILLLLLLLLLLRVLLPCELHVLRAV
jgi:hypothetical protein